MFESWLLGALNILFPTIAVLPRASNGGSSSGSTTA